MSGHPGSTVTLATSDYGPLDEAHPDDQLLRMLESRIGYEPLTMGQLLGESSGETRNTRLTTIHRLQIFDVISIDPAWTDDQLWQQRDHEADLQADRNQEELVEDLADDLLHAVLRLGERGRRNAGMDTENAIRMAVQLLRKAGDPFNCGEVGYYTESQRVVDSCGASGWPKTQHLRIHWLADRDIGWVCRDCGVGLIDVCRDDDVVTGRDGLRVLAPDCKKRLPTLDHKIPRDLRGSDDPENLELVCRPCNSRKGAA